MTFIDEHRGQFAVALLLRVLDVEESTYYAWVKHAEQPCDRAMVDRGLLSNIYEIWTTSGCTYGSDRLWRQLRRDDIAVGRKRVERLMRGQGWQGAFLRRGWRTGSTRQDPNATPAPECDHLTWPRLSARILARSNRSTWDLLIVPNARRRNMRHDVQPGRRGDAGGL